MHFSSEQNNFVHIKLYRVIVIMIIIIIVGT